MPEAKARQPLADYALFHSTNLDEARDRVAAVFCPHRLDTIGRNAQLDASHHHLAGDGLSLNYIEYGAKTLIAPGELAEFYLLQIPLTGAAAISNGSDRYYSDQTRAAVLNPHLPTAMIWEEGTRQVLVQIDRKAMMDHLAAQLGYRADRPLTFTGTLDLTRGPGATLRHLVLFLVREADQGRRIIGQGLTGRQVEATLMSSLLDAHRHDFQDHIGRVRAAPRPRHLRLAESYIEAHLDQPLTLEQVASAAGISPRGLQVLFRKERGTTPLGFWRDKRLTRAHQDLAAGLGSVTDVAMKWGFAHFGRFAQSYRARYGLSPRETMQASRGVGYRD